MIIKFNQNIFNQLIVLFVIWFQITTYYCLKLHKHPISATKRPKIDEPVLDYGEDSSLEDTLLFERTVNTSQSKNLVPEGAKIVGGSITNVKRWPWMAGLLRKGKSVPFCGGSLINRNTIVTAGHCLKKETPSNLKVRLGSTEMRSGKREIHSREYSVKSLRVHPNYDYPHNDIAVLKLKNNVKYTKYIKPITVDGSGSDHSGRSAYVTGWGTTSYRGRQSRKLKEVGLKVWNTRNCNRAIKDFSITTDMICAGDPHGQRKDACQGDSGGPLMTHNSKSWTLIGVVSFGDKCGKPNMPGVYTRINKYVNWIKSQSI